MSSSLLAEFGEEGDNTVSAIPQPPQAVANQQVPSSSGEEEWRKKFVEASLKVDRLQREKQEAAEAAEAARLARLPAEERSAEEMVRLRQQVNQMNAALHASMMVAYRERAIREYGTAIFPEMVQGNSEADIDVSARKAHETYLKYKETVRKEVEQEMQTYSSSQQSRAAEQQVQQQYTLPPQNPAYTPPPGNWLPQFANAAASQAPQPPTELEVADLTSEAAVRRGVYSGELRERLLAQVRGGPGYYADPGSVPRTLPAVRVGGADMPQGLPTAPVRNPRMVQLTAQQQAPSQQWEVPAQTLQNPNASLNLDQAVARHRAGANPTATSETRQIQAQAHSLGVTPEEAFSARFNN